MLGISSSVNVSHGQESSLKSENKIDAETQGVTLKRIELSFLTRKVSAHSQSQAIFDPQHDAMVTWYGAW